MQKKILRHAVSHERISKSLELVLKLKLKFKTTIEKPEQIEKIFTCIRYLSPYIPNHTGRAKL
jgi:hypothetical protein